MKPTTPIIIRYIKRAIYTLFAIIIMYIIAATIGGTFSANRQWTQATNTIEDPIDIYVETNGIHVSIILPLDQDEGILSNKLRASHMKNPQYHSQYAMIGWGHKGVYQNAQNWNDLTIKDAASAVFGTGDALLHIYYRDNPKPNEYRKKISISNIQYRHIMRNIAQYFRYNDDGKLLVYEGYGPNNIFYAANGQYSALNTCNVWVGRILREAGITIGYWTPFSQSIMWRY